MNTRILGLLAETPIHPGAGQSASFIDLPVAREAATDYPVIVGSSLKGALLGLAREREMPEPERDAIFGKSDNAGALIVSDARLLLLPVRSLSSTYNWVTCPHLLERFARDGRRAGGSNAANNLEVGEDKYLGADDGALFLEERQLTRAGDLPSGVVEKLQQLIAHAETRGRLARQLVIVSDRDFAWFARYGLAVNARNVLDPDRKTSENLWYEETLPADSVFYALLAERQKTGALEKVASLFDGRPYLQAGGNETVGMGWFAVTFLPEQRS